MRQRKRKKLDFRIDEDGCFIVTSHRHNGEGYAYMYHEGGEQRAHRVVYQECFGEIPEGLVVRHQCDNRACINPEHLVLGTQKENMRDRLARGRAAIGERNGSSKITEEMAREIKIMLRDGIKPREIIIRLNVSDKTVRAIRENLTWKHVEISDDSQRLLDDTIIRDLTRKINELESQLRQREKEIKRLKKSIRSNEVKNKYEIRGEVTAIFINSTKYGQMETLISTSELERVQEFKNTWYASYSKKTNSFYARGNMTLGLNKRRIFGIHQWIMGLPESSEIDHIDHDTLNNTNDNLRILTPTENKQNKRRARSDSSSGIRGVGWDKRVKKWHARIKILGKTIHVGYFDDLNQADSAVKEARQKYMPYSNDKI